MKFNKLPNNTQDNVDIFLKACHSGTEAVNSNKKKIKIGLLILNNMLNKPGSNRQYINKKIDALKKSQETKQSNATISHTVITQSSKYVIVSVPQFILQGSTQTYTQLKREISFKNMQIQNNSYFLKLACIKTGTPLEGHWFAYELNKAQKIPRILNDDEVHNNIKRGAHRDIQKQGQIFLFEMT